MLFAWYIPYQPCTCIDMTVSELYLGNADFEYPQQYHETILNGSSISVTSHDSSQKEHLWHPSYTDRSQGIVHTYPMLKCFAKNQPIIVRAELEFSRCLRSQLLSLLAFDIYDCLAVLILFLQDIADAAWKTKKRKPKLPNVGLLVADMLFSILVQTLFLLQVFQKSYNSPLSQILVANFWHNFFLGFIPLCLYEDPEPDEHRRLCTSRPCYTHKRRKCRKRRNLGGTNVTPPQTLQSRVDKRHTTH